MHESRIAIVGLACQYPDAADSPDTLWRNVLSQRRAFRRLPAERLRLDDYLDAGTGSSVSPDTIYSSRAAVLHDYAFDRARFRIGGHSYRAADTTHWLALDVADAALADAGFDGGEGLPRDETSVVIGNSLTGEFTRAGLMRLRWPYVRRQTRAVLRADGLDEAHIETLLEALERQYKEPFPEPSDESLAGGLANTIAGRIANQFDLHGGGFTVDGACASSLLAVTQACTALAMGDATVALAGGVDLSIDPFELVGFARTGALARDEMRVFDRRPTGFIPGEGCGIVVLMRLDDALAQGRRIYAVARGWGVSSDGHGGLTRPETDGQLLALRRAYRRAGFGPDSVGHFEAHGTGTAVGDVAELTTLDRARREAGARDRAAVSTIKGQIGHTKAAAGVAGLIKATLAVHHQVLPPTPGCHDLHDRLRRDDATLRVLDYPEAWPTSTPLRAAASAMGFGGINTHVVFEGVQNVRRRDLVALEHTLARTPQDAELLVLSAADPAALADRARALAERVAGASVAELADLGAALVVGLADDATRTARAAVVASTPTLAAERLHQLAEHLAGPAVDRVDGPEIAPGVFVGLAAAGRPARVGFLFPGQASPAHLGKRAWRRRFTEVESCLERADLPTDGDGVETSIAQPAIATASLAGLAVLDRLGVEASAAVGHSLGEWVALHWAGAFDADALVALTRARGRAMSELGSNDGAMASLATDVDTAEALSAAVGGMDRPVLAGLNGPGQTVIAGRRPAVEQVVHAARERGHEATLLAVSHAFHSPLVAAARPRLEAALAGQVVAAPTQRVASTITGRWWTDADDPKALLADQVTSPVRFAEALEQVAADVDVLVEVGPGQVLGRLARRLTELPVVSIDANGDGLADLLQAVGCLFAVGAAVDVEALFADRFVHPIDLDREPRFLINPCELAPLDDGTPARVAVEPEPVERSVVAPPIAVSSGEAADGAPDHAPGDGVSVLDSLLQIVARRIELPVDSIDPDSRLLADLHLSSIAAGELVTEAYLANDLAPPAAPTEYANASLRELAEVLDQVRAGRSEAAPVEALPDGVDAWVRSFSVEWQERPSRGRAAKAKRWRVLGDAGACRNLADALADALPTEPNGGAGWILALDGEPTSEIDEVLELTRATTISAPGPLVVLGPTEGIDGATAFVRTLHLEKPDRPVTVVRLPLETIDSAEAIEAWIPRLLPEAVDRGFCEVRLDARGGRREPVIRALPDAGPSAVRTPPKPLASGDVLVVTGGGKGIGAECALDLARRFEVRLAVFGRSGLDDPELAGNLQRFTAHGVEHHYVSVDLGDAAAVRDAVAEVAERLGPVRGIVHSAGVNRPRLIDVLEREDVEATLRPKVDGLEHLLAAVEPTELSLLVAFGSIIGRMGLRGEADYAFANARLRRRLERFAADHPACRTLCIEWSVWEGVGMGARLADLEGLERQGIQAIPVDAGLEALRRLLDRPSPVAVLVSGRFGTPPTFAVERPELPLWRFLEAPRVHVPGVELVADAEVSALTDFYLADHVFQGEPLVPAVVGLEAMAQVALALLGRGDATDARGLRFRDIRLDHPVVVPNDDTVTVRLAALVREPGTVEVVLRTSRHRFRVDCFRAVLEWAPETLEEPTPVDGAMLPLDPEQLYDGVLFHTGRFRQVRGYRKLRATECLAVIEAEDRGSWFGSLHPSTLLLGDPGARDASIHAIQACIPHATVLPVAIERLELGPAVGVAGPRHVAAIERRRDGRTLVYDLDVVAADGVLAERWHGLTLQVVEEPRVLPLAPPLLGPYLERRLGDFAPDAELRVGMVYRNGHERPEGGRLALETALGHHAEIRHRPDGKPEVDATSELAVSIAHSDRLTLAVAGHGPIGCDLEVVRGRDEDTWHRLLDPQWDLLDLLCREHGETLDLGATRLWAVVECLKKAGRRGDHPLTLKTITDDGWTLFGAGEQLAAAVLLTEPGVDQPVVAAVLADPRSVHDTSTLRS